MTRQYTPIFRTAIAALLSIQAAESAAQLPKFDKVHIGIVYPLSTNGTDAPADTNHFSLHLIAGVSAEEKGLAFAGLSNFVKHNVHGLAFSGFSNHIGNKANGLLFAGFLNTYGDSRGLQFAGFGNVAVGNGESAQFAGFFNLAKEIKGAQFAGFANVAMQVQGTQVAGFTNVAKGVRGSQISGFANIGEDVSGSQISGFANVARKVKGIQLAAFINVADSSDHPIGIINIIRNGEKSIGLSTDETQTSLLSFRSGGKKLYGIIGAGYNWKDIDDEMYAFEAGLGAHFFLSNLLRLNTEIATVYLDNFHTGEYFKSSLRIFPALKLGKTIEIFGGPTLNLVHTNTLWGETLVNDYLWKRESRSNRDYFHGLYIGYAGGLHFTF
ncbi:hypothetical protein B0I27_101192 [Arcticibacter pallidicorallinus]|uniref:Porin-like protein n=1 Tax=Arcticibacter pallidicorallinus TaxID=1259464 RepID=A0A2T0UBF6_9SPHI|nr:hypothetical protein [Arcticibacter pallidicorallinus]PRY55224.1 hypothetical protein B0I27_101192 [Arcticibacter pallidicorallinus]